MRLANVKLSLPERGVHKEVLRNLKVMHLLRGIWKGKKMPDAVTWQRRVRRDAAR